MVFTIDLWGKYWTEQPCLFRFIYWLIYQSYQHLFVDLFNRWYKIVSDDNKRQQWYLRLFCKDHIDMNSLVCSPRRLEQFYLYFCVYLFNRWYFSHRFSHSDTFLVLMHMISPLLSETLKCPLEKFWHVATSCLLVAQNILLVWSRFLTKKLGILTHTRC